MYIQDFIWILLPVAAASGWWAANRSARKCQKERKEGNPVYFRGLNHLLNEEPDKAIDVFVEMLEVDSETVETHLALGNLFRRKGEVDRAIRIHQNLIARPALSREQRAQALLELGQDYMRAGLYDRAENLFKELKESRMYVEHALRNLLQIYQQEKDWEACLDTVDALELNTGLSQAMEKSHYYCELALRDRSLGQNNKAQSYLKKALSVNKACVRANHLMAQFAQEQGDSKAAVKLLRAVVEQDPEYLPEVLTELTQAHKAMGDLVKFRTYLDELVIKYPNRGAELCRAELLKDEQGEDAAAQYLVQHIGKTPSMPSLIRLIEFQCRLPEVGSEHLLHGLRDHLTRLVSERASYQCGKCGFQAKTLHWQCPSCKTWSSIKRKPLLESDS